ncbi:diguanylate cyclase domain-containing protein [Jeotgalibacillus sp. JSM ZJ347]|uniref:diguanylate cyclase domain-containing protein n=1 Tax=Jeotgalibacillus sp. JSM ZJ347 TaxID=3342117 RepID=UPI0035A959AE
MFEYSHRNTDNLLDFVRLFDIVEDLVFLMGVQGDQIFYEYINQAAKNLTALSEEVIGKSIGEVVRNKAEAAALNGQYLDVAYTKKSINFTHTISNGTKFYTGDTTLYPLLDTDGECRFILGIVKDVTEKHALEQKLKETEELFRIITENTTDVIRIIDPNGVIRYSSPSCEITDGFSAEYYVGKHFSEVIDERDRLHIKQQFETLINKKKSMTVELRHVNRDGHYTWKEVVATPIFQGDQVMNVVTSSRDITERVEYREKLSQMAFYDHLSGLPNRRLLEDRLEMAISQSERTNKKIGLLFLDGRDFKSINDRFGHEMGDEVIVATARILERCLRKVDTVGRLGGDEFVVVLPDITEDEDIFIVVNRIANAFSDPLNMNGTHIDFKFDIGVAIYPTHATEKKAFLKCADQALYKAKINQDTVFQLFDGDCRIDMQQDDPVC